MKFFYKGYVGEASKGEINYEGKLLHINDVVTFQASSLQNLESSFRQSVDSYLDFCKKLDKKPSRVFWLTYFLERLNGY